MSEPILEMKNISKNFGSVIALKNVDLEVYPGEIRGLIGENGSGKSTISSIAAGMQKATSEYDRCATKWNRNGCAGERNHFGGNRCRKYFSGRAFPVSEQAGDDQ